MTDYVKRHMVEEFTDHVLEEIPAGDRVKMFKMRRPDGHPHPYYWCYLVFTPIGLLIGGDLFGRGIVGPRVNFDLFSKDLKDCHEYLASKFFTKEWQACAAQKWCRQHASEIRTGDHDPSSPQVPITQWRAQKFAEYIRLADDLEGCVVESLTVFASRLEKLGYFLDGDGAPGYDYPHADAGWLCVLQKRFHEEWVKLKSVREMEPT